MGSKKQADTLVRLAGKAGIFKNMAEPEILHAWVMQASHAEIQEIFDRVNRRLNFNPETSPSSNHQRTYGFDLEKELGLSQQERSSFPKMSHAEADRRIKTLLAKRANEVLVAPQQKPSRGAKPAVSPVVREASRTDGPQTSTADHVEFDPFQASDLAALAEEFWEIIGVGVEVTT